MPMPVLQAMVLADHVYQDLTTGKCIICGTFSQITRSKRMVEPTGEIVQGSDEFKRIIGPVSNAGSPYLYLALAEVHGQVPLELKLVHLDDASVSMRGTFTVSSKSPLNITEYIVPVPTIAPNKLGVYSLDLLCENEILGSWRVIVKDSDQSGSTET